MERHHILTRSNLLTQTLQDALEHSVPCIGLFHRDQSVNLALTRFVFWAVIDVITDIPNTPFAAIAFRSA